MLRISLYIKNKCGDFFIERLHFSAYINLSPSRTNNKFDLELKRIKNSAKPLSISIFDFFNCYCKAKCIVSSYAKK